MDIADQEETHSIHDKNSEEFADEMEDSDFNDQSQQSQSEDLTEENLDQIEIEVEPGAAIRKM